MVNGCLRNFEKGSFDWKWKGLFLVVKSDRRATNPSPTPTIFPETSNQNFEIAILFNVNGRSRNYVFKEETLSPEPSGLRFPKCM